METFFVGIIVGVAALFIINRFRGYMNAAKMEGGGCCGTCGCRASTADIVKIDTKTK